VQLHRWRPGSGVDDTGRDLAAYGGVARKPWRAERRRSPPCAAGLRDETEPGGWFVPDGSAGLIVRPL